MSGWIKGAMLALSVMVTAGVLSVFAPTAASADEPVSGPLTVRAEQSGTFAEQTAAKAFRKVKATYLSEKRKAMRIAKRHGRTPVVRDITDVRRWQALPVAMRAPMQGLVASHSNRNDDDGLVTFFTGVNDTAACLTMRTGKVARGLCGLAYQPNPATLTLTYDSLIRSIQWFDARVAIYGRTARSAALVASLVRTDAPAGTEAQIMDVDADGIVDDGTVLLVAGSSCGTVVLPDHDPTGATYRAELRHETCDRT